MLATYDDAVFEYAANFGRDLPADQQPAWILSPFDTWSKNPRYCGPAVPHPESNWDEEMDGPYFEPTAADSNIDDDIPF